LVETETAVVPSGSDFGVVQHAKSLVPKYKGCVDGGKWCFRLEEMKVEHGFGVHSLGRTDVSSAADPVVTPASCAAIIADLTPPAAGAGHGPPRSTYWSSAFTTAHERFHVSDGTSGLLTPTMTDLATFVSAAANCTTCKSSPPASFNAQAATIFRGHAATWLPGAEIRAHNVSNPMYAGLIAAIRARANAAPPGTWPAACK